MGCYSVGCSDGVGRARADGEKPGELVARNAGHGSSRKRWEWVRAVLADESAAEKSKKIDRATVASVRTESGGGAALEGIAAGDTGIDGERS